MFSDALPSPVQGLGKTLQTIAFLAALLGKEGKATDARSLARRRGAPLPPASPRVLVVVPKSLLTNWKRELEQWGSFDSEVLYGPRKPELIEAVISGRHEIAVTTYDVMRSTPALRNVDWAVAVFDEAHCLQNAKILTYKAAASVRCGFRLCLTGTPVSNDLDQVHALFDLVVPGSLGELKEFRTYYKKPVLTGKRTNSTLPEIALYTKRAKQLYALTLTHMLQRKKASEDIMAQLGSLAAALPKKTDFVVFCDMSELQRRCLLRMLRSEDFELLRRADEPCDCGSGAKRGMCCHTTCDGEFFNLINHDECGKPACPYCMQLRFISYVINVANHLELAKADPKEARKMLQRARFFCAQKFFFFFTRARPSPRPAGRGEALHAGAGGAGHPRRRRGRGGRHLAVGPVGQAGRRGGVRQAAGAGEAPLPVGAQQGGQGAHLLVFNAAAVHPRKVPPRAAVHLLAPRRRHLHRRAQKAGGRLQQPAAADDDLFDFHVRSLRHARVCQSALWLTRSRAARRAARGST